MSDKLREIPPVDRLVAQVEDTLGEVPRVLLVEAVRQAVDDLRQELRAGGGPEEALADWFQSGGFAADTKSRTRSARWCVRSISNGGVATT